MTTSSNESYADAYHYAYNWYARLSRNDLEEEIEILEQQVVSDGRQYNPLTNATLHAAKDKHYDRFHGVARNNRKDNIPGKIGGRNAEIPKVVSQRRRQSVYGKPYGEAAPVRDFVTAQRDNCAEGV